MGKDGEKYNDFSMLDLFRMETENHCAVLSDGLLALERDPAASDLLESLMRAAHSIKGAARIVDLEPALKLAHTMEDVFVAAQKGTVTLGRNHIDVLLRGVDMFIKIAGLAEEDDQTAVMNEVEEFIESFKAMVNEDTSDSATSPASPQPPEPAAQSSPTPAEHTAPKPRVDHGVSADSLKVATERMNQLMWLAGESVVAARRMPALSSELLHLKYRQASLAKLIDGLWELMNESNSHELIQEHIDATRQKAKACCELLAQCYGDMEEYTCQAVELSQKLYREVLSTRMRPFSDATKALPRLVRDLSRSLGKEVRLEISGAETLVDRDVLEKLDAPLTHLLNNAVDHGIEPPDEREIMGKQAEATIRLEAFHKSGMLYISVADDGRGIDLENIRKTVIRKKLVAEDMAAALDESELLEFLFLPNFTTKESVTRVSGRGVGLDVVRNMVQEIHGSVYAESRPGEGTRFELVLPLNLSVVKVLLVEVCGDLYAFPVAHIDRAIKIPKSSVEEVEGRQYFSLDGKRIALVAAEQLLEQEKVCLDADELSVIVLSDRQGSYGLLIKKFVGIQEVAVQPLDPRLGKVQDISAAAILDDGTPVLIADVEDMIRSIEILISKNSLKRVEDSYDRGEERKVKRILVVDDSITVRELERRLLSSKGYHVDVAVDGLDGWNAVRRGRYDLVVTDVDMPRMNGTELVRTIKSDHRLGTLPVMIVSYKDREEDRTRGLNAGADYYLTKGSFHDETLVKAVNDLIGSP